MVLMDHVLKQADLGNVESKEKGKQQFNRSKKALAETRIKDRAEMSRTQYLWKYYKEFMILILWKPPGWDYLHDLKKRYN